MGRFVCDEYEFIDNLDIIDYIANSFCKQLNYISKIKPSISISVPLNFKMKQCRNVKVIKNNCNC